MRSQYASALRKNPTEAERALWRHIRRRQLDECKFRRQCLLGRYIVDFVCLVKKLIAEIDGGHHAEQVALDAHRTAWLEAQGFRVLRF
jgi:very-short-patch-repair endonuclease